MHVLHSGLKVCSIDIYARMHYRLKPMHCFLFKPGTMVMLDCNPKENHVLCTGKKHANGHRSNAVISVVGMVLVRYHRNGFS